MKNKKQPFFQSVSAEIKKNKYLYILTVPVAAFYIIFLYGPMFGLVIAFKDYNIGQGLWASAWVGFKYFREYFESVYFLRTLGNTFIISVLDILFGFPFPIIFALMLNELKWKGLKKLAQTSSYLPHFISTVVICGMIADFFGTDGLISGLIAGFGGENINYVGAARYFRPVFIGTNIWQGFGWGSIIYLAALSGVNSELYEAATIDGAGRWKQLWNVTLPGIAPTVIIMLIMRLGQVLSVGYEKIILLYSPQTYEVADVISSYTYRSGIAGSRFGYSAAVGLFQSFINVAVLFAANRLAKKYTDTSLF
jgi:putative aldouronate transport system permease protein